MTVTTACFLFIDCRIFLLLFTILLYSMIHLSHTDHKSQLSADEQKPATRRRTCAKRKHAHPTAPLLLFSLGIRLAYLHAGHSGDGMRRGFDHSRSRLIPDAHPAPGFIVVNDRFRRDAFEDMGATFRPASPPKAPCTFSLFTSRCFHSHPTADDGSTELRIASA